MNIIKYWHNGVKAWLRGEKRIAPRKARGRVFEKIGTTAKGEYKLTGLRVIRKNGTIEEMDI